MRYILKNRLPLIIIVVVAIVLVGVKIIKEGDIKILSKTADSSQKTTFVQVSKQFAMTVPTNWSITEPTNGKQTFVYPTNTKISANDAQTLFSQDVIIVETAINKKDSFEALINEVKTAVEKTGDSINVAPVDYGTLKGNLITVNGQNSYQQLFFNTPTVIIVSAKIGHPIFEELVKSVSIDITVHASDIAQATNLTRQTKDNLAINNFSAIYQASSDNLKKQKTEDEFNGLLTSIGTDFNNNVLIWGIFINEAGLGSAVNVVNQDKIIRRASFFYIKSGNQYFLDALRISGPFKAS